MQHLKGITLLESKTVYNIRSTWNNKFFFAEHNNIILYFILYEVIIYP